MFPNYHFPPTPFPVPMSYQQMVLLPTSNPKLKPSGLNYISLWCSYLKIYLPLLLILDISLVSWRMTSLPPYFGSTPPPLLLDSHQLKDIAWILASLYFFYDFWLLFFPELLSVIFCFPQQASVALFSAISSIGTSLITSRSPSKSSSTCTLICGVSQILFLTPALHFTVILYPSDVRCSLHSSFQDSMSFHSIDE